LPVKPFGKKFAPKVNPFLVYLKKLKELTQKEGRREFVNIRWNYL